MEDKPRPPNWTVSFLLKFLTPKYGSVLANRILCGKLSLSFLQEIVWLAFQEFLGSLFLRSVLLVFFYDLVTGF